MTTIAMIAGMIPITINLHGGNSFRAPMGAAVIGGLLASTALSLFVVPVVYTNMDNFEHSSISPAPTNNGTPAIASEVPIQRIGAGASAGATSPLAE